MIKQILILLIMATPLFGQYFPNSYQLGARKLAKTNAATPASNYINAIIASDNLVILGTSRGLSLSEDNGESWINLYNTEPFGTDGLSAIGYDNGVIWAATVGTIEKDGSLYSMGTGIKYSTDGGTTWISLPQPYDDRVDTIISYGNNIIRVIPVTTTITNISFDISFTKNTIWITSYAGGLRKSTDMGETWERVLLPPDTLNSFNPDDMLTIPGDTLNLYSIIYDPDSLAVGDSVAIGKELWLNSRAFSVLVVDDSTLYVGTAGGINKSTDNGKSWKKFSHQNQANPISGNFVVGLGFNEADNSIWAATWKAEDLEEFWGVSHSSDGGENWKVTLPEEKAHNFGFKYLSDGSSHVFAPTDRGIFRSSNNGGTWIQPTSITDSYTNVPIATNIFYSVSAHQLNATDYNIWVGSNKGLSRLSETNGFWEGDWKVYLASQEVKIDETYAFPNPFSPAQELVTIKYSLNSDAKVTIRIMNFSMELVRTLIQNTQRGSGNRFEFWDGKDELGNVVTNGVYFYRVESDAISEPLFGKIMVLK